MYFSEIPRKSYLLFFFTLFITNISHAKEINLAGYAEKEDYFGSAVAYGDFDGNGYDELAVGIIGEESSSGPKNCGNIQILSGGDYWMDGINSYFVGTTSCQTDMQQGTSLTVADFDQDGHDDLVVGMPYYDGVPGSDNNEKDAGAAYILFGNSNGLKNAERISFYQITYTGTLAGNVIYAQKNQRAGFSLAAGDFDGNGFPDLAIGTPGDDDEMGYVKIFYFLANREYIKSDPQFIHQDTSGIAGGREKGDQFGFSLAAGYFDSDHYADLAVGVPYESIGDVKNAGAVNVIYGSIEGLNGDGDQMWHQDQSNIVGYCEKDDFFGYSLAAGDFNDDGLDDLVIGIPGEEGQSTDIGAIHILYSNSNGLSSKDDIASIPLFWGNRLGTSVATGDINGDGYDDIVAGAPSKTCGTFESNCDHPGSVIAYFGGHYGADTDNYRMLYQGLYGVDGELEDHDLFGAAVAIGNANNDPYADLAVGVPHESIGDVKKAGAVNLFFNEDHGVSTAYSIYAHQ